MRLKRGRGRGREGRSGGVLLHEEQGLFHRVPGLGDVGAAAEAAGGSHVDLAADLALDQAEQLDLLVRARSSWMQPATNRTETGRSSLASGW